MQIYLPIAEMAVPMDLLLGMAIAVGFISGIFGVGGGFIMTPILILMGVPPTIAVGTQSNMLVASSITGVIGHWRKGNVDTHIGLFMLAGSALGAIIGVFIFGLLKYFGQIDVFISVSYVIVLGIIGSLMLVESLNSWFKFLPIKKSEEGGYFTRLGQRLPYKMRFVKSSVYTSAFIPAGIGFFGGLLVSVLGVGGGFMLVPAMIYILRMSPSLVAGTSLFQIIFTSAFTTILHAAINHSVDLVLGLVLIVGSVIGAQFGVRFTRYISPVMARFLMAAMIMTVVLKLLSDLVIEPDQLYSIVVRE